MLLAEYRFLKDLYTYWNSLAHFFKCNDMKLMLGTVILFHMSEVRCYLLKLEAVFFFGLLLLVYFFYRLKFPRFFFFFFNKTLLSGLWNTQSRHLIIYWTCKQVCSISSQLLLHAASFLPPTLHNCGKSTTHSIRNRQIHIQPLLRCLVQQLVFHVSWLAQSKYQSFFNECTLAYGREWGSRKTNVSFTEDLILIMWLPAKQPGRAPGIGGEAQKEAGKWWGRGRAVEWSDG